MHFDDKDTRVIKNPNSEILQTEKLMYRDHSCKEL